jgi:hypothetical protein
LIDELGGNHDFYTHTRTKKKKKKKKKKPTRGVSASGWSFVGTIMNRRTKEFVCAMKLVLPPAGEPSFREILYLNNMYPGTQIQYRPPTAAEPHIFTQFDCFIVSIYVLLLFFFLKLAQTSPKQQSPKKNHQNETPR